MEINRNLHVLPHKISNRSLPILQLITRIDEAIVLRVESRLHAIQALLYLIPKIIAEFRYVRLVILLQPLCLHRFCYTELLKDVDLMLNLL